LSNRCAIAMLALPILGACNGGGLISDQASPSADSVDLRTSFTSIAALAHFQAEARSADAARATAIVYNMHQAATGMDGEEAPYGNSRTENDCAVSGSEIIHYSISDLTPTAGDTLTISELACARTGSSDTFSTNGLESWTVLSGSIAEYDAIDLDIQQQAKYREHSDNGEETQFTSSMRYTIARDGDSYQVKVTDSTLKHSQLGETIVHLFEEKIEGDVCERSYNIQFYLDQSIRPSVGLLGYNMSTLSPIREEHLETEDGDNYVHLSDGKVRISVSDGSIIEYAAVEGNRVNITLDTNADGSFEAQKTLDYDTFLDGAYGDNKLAALSENI